MKVIDPKIEVERYNGKKIMKNIERACRTCYRSENSISNTSYSNLLQNCINRGHESVLEHEKITVRLTCDIGVYKDLTRHRFGSFSIESTRYCNYNRNKFGNEIKFIKPVFYMDSWVDKEIDSYTNDEYRSCIWWNAMEDVQFQYMAMSNIEGTTPDMLRMLLPHSTAAEVTMTANIREWKHILTLRCTKHAHPAINQLLIPLLLEFKKTMPEIFNKIEYNTEFPVDRYAKLTYID